MLISPLKKTASGKILLLNIFIVFVAGLALSLIVFNTVNEQKRSVLVHRAESVSATIDSSLFLNLSAEESDANKIEYKKLKSIFKSVAGVNPDVRFVYAFGKSDDGKIYFYADSEDPSSKDFSPPGQEYPEASDVLVSTFESGKSAIEGPVTDRWGTWISAISPLEIKTNKVNVNASSSVKSAEEYVKTVVIGMDIEAKSYLADIIAYSVAPIGVSLIIILFLYFNFRTRRKNDEITATKLSFVELASHELRSPLAGIRWALESLLSPISMLQTDTDKSFAVKNEKKLLSDIYDRSNAMMTTINNVTDVIALESGIARKFDLVSLDLRNVLSEAISKVKAEAEKKLVIIEENLPSPNEVIIEGDLDHLSRAYSEIIINAITYSKPGDKVYIKCEAHNQFVIVDIIDNGIGIHPEIVSAAGKKFTIFHRSSSYKVGGTGLGIYLAQKIFEMHGGKISFSSGKGQGTVVHTRLPVIRRN